MHTIRRQRQQSQHRRTLLQTLLHHSQEQSPHPSATVPNKPKTLAKPQSHHHRKRTKSHNQASTTHQQQHPSSQPLSQPQAPFKSPSNLCYLTNNSQQCSEPLHARNQSHPPHHQTSPTLRATYKTCAPPSILCSPPTEIPLSSPPSPTAQTAKTALPDQAVGS